MCMGHIYQIRNLTNNAVYIGSVLKRNPQDRWMRHLKDLRNKRHHSPHLQRAWNKYGETNFVFEILKTVSGNPLLDEQFYLDDRRKNFPSHLNYNVCWKAGNCEGRKWSKEMRKKLSTAHRGMRPTPDAKLKQQASWAAKCRHPYSFTSPNGIVHDNIRNLRAFAREHILDARSLALLHRGSIHYFKGWIKTGTSMPSYQLCDPNGLTTRGPFLKHLCSAAGINYKMIHKYCIKNKKPYLGWMAEKTS